TGIPDHRIVILAVLPRIISMVGAIAVTVTGIPDHRIIILTVLPRIISMVGTITVTVTGIPDHGIIILTIAPGVIRVATFMAGSIRRCAVVALVIVGITIAIATSTGRQGRQ